MKIGIADVAKAAGVSPATVSRVVNNPTLVAPSTRRSVETAMREVGYSKPALANLVLLITPGLQTIFGVLTERLTVAMSAHGMRSVACSTPAGGSQELEYVTAMADAGIAGAVFVSTSNTIEGADPAVHRLLTSRGIPFVCINGSFVGVEAPTLSSDDLLASEIAVDHLWNLGHRAIALIAGPVGNRPSDRRVKGFEAAMARRGAEGVVAHQEYSVEGGVTATNLLFSRNLGITGLIAASDEIALGALKAARRHGRRVPRDLSIVGYDDALPLEFVDPPLTSVRQPVDRLSDSVTRVMLRLIQNRPVPHGELFFEPELVIRESTAPAPRS